MPNKKVYTVDDITTGFEFKFDGIDVVIKTDYQKWDRNKDFVQIVKKSDTDASAGQLSKDMILEIVNTD